MEGKLNVLLILERNQSFRMIDVFEPMLAHCELKAISFLHDLRSGSFLTEIPLQTFVEDEHMPGYLRGMEEELAKADIIVASGLEEVSTFQAFRFAHSHNKPFFVFCYHESQLKRYLERRSDEFQDCIQKASGFIVYDQGAAEHLEYLGVEVERILCLKPQILAQRYKSHGKLRERFRKYIQVGADEYLVVCDDSEGLSAMLLLRALSAWTLEDPATAAKVKLLISGLGQNKESIKYLAVDLGLTKTALFISQDTRPFITDLLSAADLQVSLPFKDGESSLDQVFRVLEGMACGVRPLVNERHRLAEQLPEDSVSSDGIAGVLEALKTAFHAGKLSQRQSYTDIVLQNFDSAGSLNTLLAFLRARSTVVPLTGPWNKDFGVSFHQFLELAQASPELFYIEIDKALELWAHHSDHRGKLQLLKAQTLLKEGSLDAAMSCFELCTAEEIVHREAYMGLARIAYLTHSSEEALSFYKKALALKPNDAEAMAGLGYVYRKCGLADEAVFWLGKSLSVDIENTKTLIALTQACMESEELDRSLTLLEQLKVLVGNKASLIMTLGQLYYRRGNNEKGRELVDLALRITEQGSTPMLLAASSDAG